MGVYVCVICVDVCLCVFVYVVCPCDCGVGRVYVYVVCVPCAGGVCGVGTVCVCVQACSHVPQVWITHMEWREWGSEHTVVTGGSPLPSWAVLGCRFLYLSSV